MAPVDGLPVSVPFSLFYNFVALPSLAEGFITWFSLASEAKYDANNILKTPCRSSCCCLCAFSTSPRLCQPPGEWVSQWEKQSAWCPSSGSRCMRETTKTSRCPSQHLFPSTSPAQRANLSSQPINTWAKINVHCFMSLRVCYTGLLCQETQIGFLSVPHLPDPSW